MPPTINLSGLKKAEPKAAKKEKPLLPDPTNELSALVNEGIEADKAEKAWTAANKLVKSQLGEATLKHAFAIYHGVRGAIEDSFKVRTGKGSVTVSMKNAYKLTEESEPAVRAMLGVHADTYLKNSFAITLDSESVPVEMQQRLIDGLIQLANNLDEEHALLTGGVVPEGGGPIFNAISVKPIVSVDKRFHEERHALFTPDHNLAIQKVMPCVTSARYEY